MIPAKCWLEPYSWEAIVYLNMQACKAGKTQYKKMPKKHAAARKLWEATRAQEQSLKEVIEICRKCHHMVPFQFFNGNTFTAVACSLIEDIRKNLDEIHAHIFRGVVEHYIAGTVDLVEFESVYQRIDQSLPNLNPAMIKAVSQPLLGFQLL